uniref:Uncharacterized protein n=1 Tax=Arundo donax TaxID=35708 RepID=A0A0A9BXI1_ARUDO
MRNSIPLKASDEELSSYPVSFFWLSTGLTDIESLFTFLERFGVTPEVLKPECASFSRQASVSSWTLSATLTIPNRSRPDTRCNSSDVSYTDLSSASKQSGRTSMDSTSGP